MTVHLPKELVDELAVLAAREGASVDELTARAVEEHLDAVKTRALFDRLRKEADWGAFERILNREGGQPPQPGDEAD